MAPKKPLTTWNGGSGDAAASLEPPSGERCRRSYGPGRPAARAGVTGRTGRGDRSYGPGVVAPGQPFASARTRERSPLKWLWSPTVGPVEVYCQIV
ncbi:hypothetical protein GCM10010305_15300 [Streptomyces termitum]|uniref:Uncharacterized protein n=1 Tax=Streptomyces termitum TaxID=67368 RepID=A0A918W7E1_9ACTN|nr:hypothetical protein GCM10010305_15300 [Streptomyces termitum]